MNVLLIPLSAIVIWLTARYLENKFEVLDPQKSGLILKRNAPNYKRFLFSNYTVIRRLGLGLLWLGSVLMAAFQEDNIGALVAGAMISIGMLIYIFSLGWTEFIGPAHLTRGRKPRTPSN